MWHILQYACFFFINGNVVFFVSWKIIWTFGNEREFTPIFLRKSSYWRSWRFGTLFGSAWFFHNFLRSRIRRPTFLMDWNDMISLQRFVGKFFTTFLALTPFSYYLSLLIFNVRSGLLLQTIQIQAFEYFSSFFDVPWCSNFSRDKLQNPLRRMTTVF